MNRFAGVIITVVAIAALVGAALGWRFPFPGQNRAANQVSTSPEATQATQQQQGANRTRIQRASQPSNQRQNNTSTTTAQAQNTGNANAQDPTIDPETTGTGQSNQPVSAFW
jgi:cytoskeletal protein RodZ